MLPISKVKNYLAKFDSAESFQVLKPLILSLKLFNQVRKKPFYNSQTENEWASNINFLCVEDGLKVH